MVSFYASEELVQAIRFSDCHSRNGFSKVADDAQVHAGAQVPHKSQHSGLDGAQKISIAVRTNRAARLSFPSRASLRSLLLAPQHCHRLSRKPDTCFGTSQAAAWSLVDI